MDFENTPNSDGGSYEKPKPGKYIGVLVGFCFCGTQPGGQYGPKPKVMLRWELHKRKGPSKDSKDFIHTVTQTFGATVRGENSMLRKALKAHGISIPEGGKTASRSWLGSAAWLDLEESPDKKYTNVAGISRLDPEDDATPTQVLPSEHWEPKDETAPPSWAGWALAKSTDLAHRAPKRTAEAEANGVPVGAGVGSTDDDEIPF